MNWRDVAELSFQRFRTRSLRFFLTVLGVSVGIGVVFFLVSLGFGLQEVVIGRVATSQSLLALTVLSPENAEGLLNITDATLEQFKSIERVDDVSPLFSSPVELTQNGLKAQSIVQAVNPSYFSYAGIEAQYGQLLGDQQADEVIVTNPVLRLFGIENAEEALGQELSMTFFIPNPEDGENLALQTEEQVVPLQVAAEGLGGDVTVVSASKPFRIVGVIEGESNAVYVPLSVFRPIPNLSYAQARVKVTSTDFINVVREELLAKGYSVIALTDTIDQLNRIFSFTQITLAILGVVALFIASVGMFNTLTISLLERTQEVGILKAIGATNRDVWKIFLFEAFLIGVLGGVGGVGGGYTFSLLVNFLVNYLAGQYGGQSVDIFSTPLWFIATITGIALCVGVFTGFYPAARAARLNALEALRRD